jgi:hypothetical protein
MKWATENEPLSCTTMKLDTELETQLRQRIKEQISCEDRGDVAGLFEFIDPEIRACRSDEYAIEPEHTLSQLRAFLSTLKSANCEAIEISAFAIDGGETRNHRPTAIVVVDVLYNGTVRSRFRTPWVLHKGRWYTRALAKLHKLA